MDAQEHRIDRRRALGLGATVAAGAWVAPVILTIDRAAAQGSGGGFIEGTMTWCGNPAQGTFDLTATNTSTLQQFFAVSDGTGFYTLGPMPAGTYDIAYTVTGGGMPDDTLLGVVVTAGATTIQALDFIGFGC